MIKDDDSNEKTEVNPFESEQASPPPTVETNEVNKKFVSRKKD